MAALGWGLLGVLCFSLTWSSTVIAVRDIDPGLVGFGRIVPAALLAAALLAASRSPVPARRDLAGCAFVGSAIVVAFPLLTSWALQTVPASRGAVTAGVMPPLTAAAAALLSGDRPSPRFWMASCVGAGAVVVYALGSDGGGARGGDLLLLVAVGVSCLGYAVGARVGSRIGSWQVICWALLLMSPIGAVGTGWVLVSRGWPDAGWSAWTALGYLSLVSTCLAFFAWYRGLTLGGTARVGQVQLVQPFLAVLFAAVLIGERPTVALLLTGSVVAVAAAIALRAPVGRAGRDRSATRADAG